MRACFVADVEITNPAGFRMYGPAVRAMLERYGGCLLTWGGSAELMEGGPEPKRMAIIEFTDKAAVKRWYKSAEHQAILPLRIDNSTGRSFIVEGVS